MVNYRKSLLFVVFSLLITLPSLAQAASIAKVIAVSSGTTIERGQSMKSLALKDDLFVKDIIRTDNSGKVQLMFNDDSVVTVGSNSTFVMEDYSQTDNVFKANLSVGFARVVTGSIVKKNPNGFTVLTPQATVGIRGTTLSIFISENKLGVATENTLNSQSVIVGETVIPPGQFAAFGPGGVVISPPSDMSDEQRNEIVLESNIAQVTSSVVPDSVNTNLFVDSDLTDPDIGSLQASLNEINSPYDINSPSEIGKRTNATVFGSLTTNAAGGNIGSFSFNANLLDGTISDGSLNYSVAGGGGNSTFSGSGGVGTIDPNSFNLGGTGVLTDNLTGSTTKDWEMNGATGIVPGQVVSGDWSVSGGQQGDFAGSVSQ